MAKVVITIEDKDNGNVSVKANPDFDTLMKMDMSGSGWTGSQGIAFACLGWLWRALKSPEANNIVKIPRLK